MTEVEGLRKIIAELQAKTVPPTNENQLVERELIVDGMRLVCRFSIDDDNCHANTMLVLEQAWCGNQNIVEWLPEDAVTRIYKIIEKDE